MTTTFVKPGKVETFTAPVGGVASGHPYMIGSLLVIATEDALVGAKFEGACVGVFTVDKPDQEAWTEGQPIYFDATASPDPLFTNVIGSPELPLVGAAVAAVPLSLVVAAEDTASPPASPPPFTLGSATIKVDSYTNLANAIITITVNGVATTLTEGSGADFLAETSDEITAANLAAAINAKVLGATAAVGSAPNADTVTITVTHPSITGNVRLDGAVR